MGKIRILSDTLANQIAAGEVVERPSSVIKELIENSIDAGTRRIRIEIELGGRRLMLVSDDGEGMLRDDAILAFERQWWKYAGAKESAIRELFDMSATRYYQVLNALLDRPEAMAFDPMLVKRLRRLRAARQRARSARRLGASV